MRVFVYWNLHRKLWSIKALEGPQRGRVIGHSPVVKLTEVTPKVSQKGRQRVLREQKKNVHAGIVGNLLEGPQAHTRPQGDLVASGWREVTYNPYKYSEFVHKDNETPFGGSVVAILEDKHVYTF